MTPYRLMLILPMILASAFALADNVRPVIHLASLEWPPYTSERLPQGGTTSAAVRRAFEAAGYDVKIDFLPWSRTVSVARDPKSPYEGYFPEYYAAEIEKDFIFSKPLGTGPLGLAQHKDRAIQWATLNDLKPYRLGVVQDYVNTSDLDRMLAEGSLRAETAISDVINLRKLGGNRLDVIVIDRHVFDFLLQSDTTLAPYRNQLEFNAKLLEEKGLYICFGRKKAHPALIDAVNARLQAADPAP